MPLYEYRCKSCGHTFEVIQKFSDRALRKCGECSGPLEKLVSRSSFQLKGGGWYINSYSSKAAPAASTPSETKPKTSTGTDSSSSGSETASG